MKKLLNLALVAALSLPQTMPAPAQAQGELSNCGPKLNRAEFPCGMAGRVANNAEDFRVFNLIRKGRASSEAEARAILQKRRANNQMPACGDAAKDTPLPCAFGDDVANTKEDWRVLNLIDRGRATTVAEARALLEARRAQNSVPECTAAFANSPLPCKMGDRVPQTEEEWRIASLIERGGAKNEAEARAILRQRAAANAPKECAQTFQQSALPCTFGDRLARTEEQWRIGSLIERGGAKNEAEARAILQERSERANLPACGKAANRTPLPCALAGFIVTSKEDWRIASLIDQGKASNEAEARAILEERRAARQQQQQTANLPACGPRAKETALPCLIDQRVARTEEEWRIFTIIKNGNAANVAEAQDLLAERRAAAAAARAAAEDAEKAEARERRRAERRERRRAERAAAAAGQNDLDTQGMQTVDQGPVRSSDEEFGAVENDDDGLSKLEKLLLLGLGAAVVGTVLKNGDKVVSNSGDRVIVESPEGDLRVLKDDDALIRRPGDQVQTRTYDDGSTRTMVTKPDGSRVITVRAADGTVLRRVNIDANGTPTVIIDDTRDERAVDVSELPQVVDGARQVSLLQTEAELRNALDAQLRSSEGRSFSLRQVREISEVRSLAPQLELDAIQFETGSAAIRPEQARALASIGTTLREVIAADPRTVILVEGHTDATGSASYNLALSDRRAETVALALTEYFRVPPENMITQGYGETSLKVPTLESEAANRRAVVRNISGLLR